MKKTVFPAALMVVMMIATVPVFAEENVPSASPVESASPVQTLPEGAAPKPQAKAKFILQAESEALKLTDDLKEVKKQLKAHPEDPEANFLAAAAYSRSPDLGKAFRYIKKTKELLKQSQDFEFIDRTIADYETLLQENPNSTVVLYRLAFGYYFKGYSIEKYPHHYKNGPSGSADVFYQKARDTMGRVVALMPNDIWARNYYGYFISENGKDWGKAVDVWEASLAIDRDHNPGAWLLLSQAYLKLGDIQKSLVYGAKGLEIQQSMGMTLP